MKLTLDHTQRLNLHALLGAQRADVGSIRAIWVVQDKLALDADEEASIELKRELVNGQERTAWNPSLSTAANLTFALRAGFRPGRIIFGLPATRFSEKGLKRG
jgi:hypothetical protein